MNHAKSNDEDQMKADGAQGSDPILPCEDAESLYEHGMRYYDSDKDGVRDYIKAVQYFRLAAERGDRDAMFMLGQCYEYGLGVEKNEEKAEQWYAKGAENAKGWSEDRLDRYYINDSGRGIDPDDSVDAVTRYRCDAERGDAWAQYKLGRCYHYGYGEVGVNDTEGEKWYRVAADSWRRRAEQGDAKAQYMLGWCHSHGFGVAQDDVECVKWYRLAAEHGHLDAQLELAKIYQSDFGTGKNLTEAVTWFLLAAEQGDAEAQNTMGVCFARGEGVAQDDIKAAKWFMRAATQENREGMNHLAEFYCLGRGVAQSYVAAATLFRKVMYMGDFRAKYNLACLYYHGWGVPQSQGVALKMCSEAAEYGECYAIYTIACHYYWGIGVEQNYKQAVRWLLKEQMYLLDTLLMLGECAAMGVDVRERRDAALRAYASAKENGITLAPNNLYCLSLSFLG